MLFEKTTVGLITISELQRSAPMTFVDNFVCILSMSTYLIITALFAKPVAKYTPANIFTTYNRRI